jgi:TPR repeat protein
MGEVSSPNYQKQAPFREGIRKWGSKLSLEEVFLDYNKALFWIRLAADQGLHDAQHFLGLTYEHGKGVSQDFLQAHMWYTLASVNGLEIADKDRDAIAKQMTPAQIAEAQQLAQEWKPKTPSASG